jgi:hypothetical protein
MIQLKHENSTRCHRGRVDSTVLLVLKNHGLNLFKDKMNSIIILFVTIIKLQIDEPLAQSRESCEKLVDTS